MKGAKAEEAMIDARGDNDVERFIREFETGFQLATFQGPLCAEPVEGLAYFVESVHVDKESLETQMGLSSNCHDIHGL